MRTLAFCVALALLLAPAGRATAGVPTDQLRHSVDEVLRILTDPDLKKAARTAERRRALRAVANEIFDFAEISRRSLGIHWQARTPAERQEFIGLFGDLLEYAYVSKIETYSGEKIAYLGEAVDGDRAIVRTRIVSHTGIETPVDYHLFLRGDRWRAYDVTIEGISLVGNYRAQFNSIIQRSGYPDLVAKLKAKAAERPGAREVGASAPPPASAPGPKGPPKSQSP